MLLTSYIPKENLQSVFGRFTHVPLALSNTTAIEAERLDFEGIIGSGLGLRAKWNIGESVGLM